MGTTYLADKLAENYTTDNFIKNLLDIHRAHRHKFLNKTFSVN